MDTGNDENNMRKRKILFYTDCYIFGGCEKTIFEIISSDKFKSQFDFILVYHFSKAYFDGMLRFKPSFLLQKTIPVRLPDISTWLYYLNKKISNKHILTIANVSLKLVYRILHPLFFIYDFFILLPLILKQRAEIIHINNGGYPGALSCLVMAVVAKVAKTEKIILTVHNIATKRKGLFELFVDYLIRKGVDFFVTASKEASLALCEKRGFFKDRMVQIYHGINSPYQINFSENPSIHRNKKVRQIAMIAVFDERKGHRVVLKALKKLLVENPEFFDIKLVLVGEGPLLKEMKDLVQIENLGNNVQFLGYRSDYTDFLKNSLFLLNPSIGYEDLPYIIIEAMSLGIPTIGTDVGGIPEEIENGITGIIIPPKDVDSLVSAMHLLLSNAQIRLEMGKNAQKRFKNLFTIDKMIERHMLLYLETQKQNNEK